LDIRAIMRKSAPPHPRGTLLVAPDVARLEGAIDAAAGGCPFPPSDTPLLVKSYRGYNVVHVGQIMSALTAYSARLILLWCWQINAAPVTRAVLVTDDLVSLEAAVDRLAPNPVVGLFNRGMHTFRKIVAGFLGHGGA
jgi:hypothetical protein